jgi:ABC-type Fe3+ transport system permease subunit
MDVARTGFAIERIRFGARARGWSRSRAPLPLLAVAVVVAFLTVLPMAYLAIRAASGETDFVAALLRPRTLGVVVNTATLATGVAMLTAAIGLPVACSRRAATCRAGGCGAC